MSGSDDTMRIGEVARRAGVTAQTIRFYERRGLLPEPPRTAAGYRTYRSDSVGMIKFIRRARDHGFSLEEIEQLLRARESGLPSVDPHLIALRRVRALETSARTTEAQRRRLELLLEKCAGEADGECSLLRALEELD